MVLRLLCLHAIHTVLPLSGRPSRPLTTFMHLHTDTCVNVGQHGATLGVGSNRGCLLLGITIGPMNAFELFLLVVTPLILERSSIVIPVMTRRNVALFAVIRITGLADLRGHWTSRVRRQEAGARLSFGCFVSIDVRIDDTPGLLSHYRAALHSRWW